LWWACSHNNGAGKVARSNALAGHRRSVADIQLLIAITPQAPLHADCSGQLILDRLDQLQAVDALQQGPLPAKKRI
jgi:hypothetical protein